MGDSPLPHRILMRNESYPIFENFNHYSHFQVSYPSFEVQPLTGPVSPEHEVHSHTTGPCTPESNSPDEK